MYYWLFSMKKKFQDIVFGVGNKKKIYMNFANEKKSGYEVPNQVFSFVINY